MFSFRSADCGFGESIAGSLVGMVSLERASRFRGKHRGTLPHHCCFGGEILYGNMGIKRRSGDFEPVCRALGSGRYGAFA